MTRSTESTANPMPHDRIDRITGLERVFECTQDLCYSRDKRLKPEHIGAIIPERFHALEVLELLHRAASASRTKVERKLERIEVETFLSATGTVVLHVLFTVSTEV